SAPATGSAKTPKAPKEPPDAPTQPLPQTPMALRPAPACAIQFRVPVAADELPPGPSARPKPHPATKPTRADCALPNAPAYPEAVPARAEPWRDSFPRTILPPVNCPTSPLLCRKQLW